MTDRTDGYRRLVASMTSEACRDGLPAEVVELQGPTGLRILCMDIGATWLSCQLPIDGRPTEMLLGSSTLSQYLDSTAYLGATIGRYANRIASGQFPLGGRTVRLAPNQSGNTLHGGPDGFHRRRWTLTQSDYRTASFTLRSPDGDQGFPGNLSASVTYSLTDDGAVQIRFQARTDAPTPVNLTNHAYFNLVDGETGPDCLGHRLQILADHYLPVDDAGIPNADPVDVGGTDFDFRDKRVIRSMRGGLDDGYDHAFLLKQPSLRRPAATLYSPDDRVRMEVSTNKPALQLYTGRWLDGIPTRAGRAYGAYAGVALETQFLPDSPNHCEWPQPSCIVGVGDRYEYTTRYRFWTGRVQIGE